MTCRPRPFTYTGAAHEPCTASRHRRRRAQREPSPVTYTDNINAGTATRQATYAGDANHLGAARHRDLHHRQGRLHHRGQLPQCCRSLQRVGTEPCSANVTGAGGLDQSVDVTHTDNTNAGTANGQRHLPRRRPTTTAAPTPRPSPSSRHHHHDGDLPGGPVHLQRSAPMLLGQRERPRHTAREPRRRLPTPITPTQARPRPRPPTPGRPKDEGSTRHEGHLRDRQGQPQVTLRQPRPPPSTTTAKIRSRLATTKTNGDPDFTVTATAARVCR